MRFIVNGVSQIMKQTIMLVFRIPVVPETGLTRPSALSPQS